MTDKQQPDPLALADEAWNFDCSEYRGARHANAAMMGKMQDCADMIRKLHAELERLALYKSLAEEYGLSIFPDIAEMTAELETLRAKLKTYEDLGDAADDVQLLRMGYAAARLEIESLKAQSAGAQPAAQPSYEHQRAIMEGERNASLDAYSRVVSITSAESRLYERAFTSGWDRRDRLASYGQAPAQAAPAAVAGPSDLRTRCDELLAWRKTGVLPGEALRTLAREKYGDEYDAIQRAERDTETEALNYVIAAPTTQPAPHPSPASQGDVLDAARYRLVRRGQHWSVINYIGDALRGEELDAAVDAARKQGGAT